MLNFVFLSILTLCLREFSWAHYNGFLSEWWGDWCSVLRAAWVLGVPYWALSLTIFKTYFIFIFYPSRWYIWNIHLRYIHDGKLPVFTIDSASRETLVIGYSLVYFHMAAMIMVCQQVTTLTVSYQKNTEFYGCFQIFMVSAVVRYQCH